jgi:hypothetical protein
MIVGKFLADESNRRIRRTPQKEIENFPRGSAYSAVHNNPSFILLRFSKANSSRKKVIAQQTLYKRFAIGVKKKVKKQLREK